MRRKKLPRNSVVVIDQRMLKSRAWLSLKGISPQVYLLFRTRCQIENRCIANNGKLVFTYKQALRDYSIKPSRFRRGIDDLIDKGFLDITGSGLGVFKVTTEYAISDRWQRYGEADFVVGSRPAASIKNPGFQRGNHLGRNVSKKFSSVEFEHGHVRQFEHGPSIAVRESEHGRKALNLRKVFA
jgi:hypothetical protein